MKSLVTLIKTAVFPSREDKARQAAIDYDQRVCKREAIKRMDVAVGDLRLMLEELSFRSENEHER